MNNREPELIKREKIGVKNYKNYVYVAIVLFVAFVGISYGAPFFIQNKKISEGRITTMAKPKAVNVSHPGYRENALGCSLPGVDGNAQCVLDYINDLLK